MASPLQKKLKLTGPTVVTANRLLDGASIWLTEAGTWSDDIAAAAVVTTPEAVQELLDIAHADESAVGAYMARAALDAAGRPAPATLRERIRVAGPTFAFLRAS